MCLTMTGEDRRTGLLEKMCMQAGYKMETSVSNCAGVLHLAGWGCELGAVCCSPGALMAVDATPSTGPGGVQDAVPFGVGDAVPVDNPRARSS